MRRASLLLSLCACGGPDHRPGTLPATARLAFDGMDAELAPAEPETGAALGMAVASAGDLDGDGFADMILGAPGTSEGVEDAGAAFVYLGSSSGLQAATALRADDPAEGDRLGEAVAGGGDLDGDGHLDVVVGAWGDSSTAAEGGSLTLWLGSSTGPDPSDALQLTAPDTQAFEQVGRALAIVDDLDGDGTAELLVGAAQRRTGAATGGSVFLALGTTSGPDLATAQELLASDVHRAQRFGQSVASVGDIDGDGLFDVIVGAPTDDAAADQAGAAYVYLGTATGLDASSEQKLTSSTATADAGLGTAVSGAGDVDGDGHADVLVGAPAAEDAGMAAGSATLWLGGLTGIDTTSEQVLISPDADAGDNLGTAVASAGDVDGDGWSDLLLGAPGAMSGGVDGAGVIVLLYGSPLGADTAGAVVLEASDPQQDAGLGQAVLGGLDLDGDGDLDLLAGAPGRTVDGETTGGLSVWTNPCEDGDGDGVCAVSDCDDTDASTGGGVLAYDDADGDGFGDPDAPAAAVACAVPSGMVTDGSDCDDTDATVSPAAEESVGDGVDGDCDGLELCYLDEDGDGYHPDDVIIETTEPTCTGPGEATDATSGGDCDDGDPEVNPGAEDPVGSGVDEDCDGIELCYVDADGDGFRADESTVASEDSDCEDEGEAPADTPLGDCDDQEPSAHDGATEVVGDGIDQDCDGFETCFVDLDGDGYRASDSTTLSEDADCDDLGEAYADAPLGDCDDNRPDTSPAAEETCNRVDDDCDGFVDGTLATGFGIWARDADGDGWTVNSDSQSGCDAPDGFASPTVPEDCNDTDASIYPGAPEKRSDGTDQDCDQADLGGCTIAPVLPTGWALVGLAGLVRRREGTPSG